MFLNNWSADVKATPPKLERSERTLRKSKVTLDVTSDPAPISVQVGTLMAKPIACYHTVLLPTAGCVEIRHAIQRLWGVNTWMIEENKKSYDRIMAEINSPADVAWQRDTRCDPDTVWHMSFRDWAKQYVPDGQVDGAIMNSPAKSAMFDLLCAWKYVRPHGTVQALIPWEMIYRHQRFHDWLEARWADIDPLPYKLYDPQFHHLELQHVLLTRCYSIDTGQLM